MKIFNALKFIAHSRGIKRGLRRILSVKKRFGFTAGKQIGFIRHYLNLLQRNNVPGTFFIPATLLAKYFDRMKELMTDDLEWGIHSDLHTDLSVLGKEIQQEHIRNAVCIFDKLKVPFAGFRAPYLRTNDFTMDVLREQGRFVYDSSVSILWDEVYQNGQRAFPWLKNFYLPKLHSQNLSLPRVLNNLVQIPVTLPDDDILLDRERLEVKSIAVVWKNILNRCYKNKEIFVLQLHPERIYELEPALDILIKQAKGFSPPIWITTLGEIAKWGKNITLEEPWPAPYQSAFCITGDIDLITISDFFDRLRKW